MDGKRAANGQHADEPDQKKAKTDGAAKPALNLVRSYIIVTLCWLPGYSSRLHR